MATLYELTDAEQRLLAMGEDGSIDPKTMADTMESIQGELHEKLTAYVKVAEEAKAKADAISAKAKAMNQRAAAYTNLAKRLKDTVKDTMVEHDWQKIETDEVMFFVKGNGGVRRIEIDEDKLPAYMYHDVMEPDKDKIKQALDEGKEIDGATYADRGTHLEVK